MPIRLIVSSRTQRHRDNSASYFDIIEIDENKITILKVRFETELIYNLAIDKIHPKVVNLARVPKSTEHRMSLQHCIGTSVNRTFNFPKTIRLPSYCAI